MYRKYELDNKIQRQEDLSYKLISKFFNEAAGIPLSEIIQTEPGCTYDMKIGRSLVEYKQRNNSSLYEFTQLLNIEKLQNNLKNKDREAFIYIPFYPEIPLIYIINFDYEFLINENNISESILQEMPIFDNVAFLPEGVKNKYNIYWRNIYVKKTQYDSDSAKVFQKKIFIPVEYFSKWQLINGKWTKIQKSIL